MRIGRIAIPRTVDASTVSANAPLRQRIVGGDATEHGT
jgi:hypothetical protein